MYGTPKDVIDLTGVKPIDFGLDNETNPDQALTDLLTTWLKRIEVAINARLVQGAVGMNDPVYEGIVEVSVRTVGRLVRLAKLQRQENISDISVPNSNSVYVDTNKIMSDLEEELKPFQKYSNMQNNKNLFRIFLS